ncbi:MAG: hypothetical protein JXR86_10540 [Spirochaetales bacterium]|nr:hypothetical protein [Spirochaetales bacterium]
MENVNLLDQKEKIFFAGCLKSLLLTDGKIEEDEITDLQELTEKLYFDSFESYLETFEERVKTIETFWEMAEKITDNEVQDLIITSLHEIMLKDHIPDTQNGKLIQELEHMWA